MLVELFEFEQVNYSKVTEKQNCAIIFIGVFMHQWRIIIVNLRRPPPQSSFIQIGTPRHHSVFMAGMALKACLTPNNDHHEQEWYCSQLTTRQISRNVDKTAVSWKYNTIQKMFTITIFEIQCTPSLLTIQHCMRGKLFYFFSYSLFWIVAVFEQIMKQYRKGGSSLFNISWQAWGDGIRFTEQIAGIVKIQWSGKINSIL